MVPEAVVVGLVVGTGPKVVRAVQRIRSGVPVSRRPSYQQHAGSTDAEHEPLFRGLPAPARKPGSMRSSRSCLGVVAEFPTVGARSGEGQRPVAVSSGTALPTPLSRQLASEPLRFRFSGWLPTMIHPAPKSGTVSKKSLLTPHSSLLTPHCSLASSPRRCSI